MTHRPCPAISDSCAVLLKVSRIDTLFCFLMASECNFKFKGITDCLLLEHSEDLHAVFTREGVLKRKVHSVWGWPGHLFVSLEGGTLIRAYQLKGATTAKQFTILAKISPVVKICFAQDTHKLILVIHKNGLVKVYEHHQPEDSSTQPWRKRAQFTLDTYKNNASVKSAIYSSWQGSRLVWVEERKECIGGSETGHYCLLTAGLEPYCRDIKEATLLLSHCPTNMDIAATHSGQSIAVLPRQPSPPGLYFKLHINSSDGTPELTTSIVREGCVRRDTSFPVNFREHSDSLAHLWSKAAKNPSSLLVSMAMEAGSGHLMLISQDGTVHASTEEEEMLREFHIPDVDVSCVSDWFVHRFVLGAVFPKETVIRFYSTTSGNLLQEVNVSQVTSAEVIHLWSMLGNVPQVGVWSDKGIWLLQMQDASEAAKLDEADTVEHLLSLGQGKMAASRQLQRAYSQLYEQQEQVEGAVCGRDPPEVLDSSIFQNDALLVSLIQGLDESKLPQFAHKLQELQERYEQRKDNEPDTSLNESMLPLLQDFWQIQQQMDQAVRSEVPARGGPTVTQEVKDTLSSDSAIPLDLRLDRLELLSQLFPERVLDCLLKEFDIEKAMEADSRDVDGSPVEERSCPLRHSPLCTAESDDGCRFLRLLCRLVFLHQPSKLISMLEFFQQCQQTASDTSAFTRRRRGMSVNGMILETLPDPTQSADIKQAALAQAHLIQTSDKDHGSMRALQLLLNYSLWEDAIRLVESHDQPDGQSHRELFHVLLCAMLMDAPALQTHSQQLWACLPPSISSLNLLQTLQINQDSVQSQIGLQQAVQGQGLTTALLKEQLHKMLAQESA